MEDDLHDHAQRTIGERPAWPKQIHVLDSIPLTSVGKIYKPRLRCDAAERLVTRLVRRHDGAGEAQVHVSEGGRRGMQVRVMLPATAAASAPEIERELAGYVFESEVCVVEAA